MLDVIKVSSKGQIVIPEHTRQKLGIKTGTRLVMLQKSDSITLEKEEQFMKSLDLDKEKLGWLALAEKSLAKVWDNEKDEEVWKKYL